MKKYLKYIDGTSDKFWQIEAQGIQFTVTYGKNGTAGTTQTKIFNTDAECLKTAEKLVAEKVKKGYSESGEVLVDKTSKAGKAKTAIQEITAEYDQIIIEKRIDDLLPFLQTKVKGNVTEFKKHLKKCEKFWCSYIDLTNEPQYKATRNENWATRGDNVQVRIINLTALAIVDKNEIYHYNNFMDFFEEMQTNPLIHEIIMWSKSNWIGDFLLKSLRDNEWVALNYETLRYLENQKLLTFNEELFVLGISRFNEYRYKKPARDFINYLLQDTQAVKRDIPLLFVYPTNLNNVYFRENDTKPSNYLKLWQVVFEELVQHNLIARSFVIEKCLLIQTKEWNNGIKGFFKNVVLEIKPITEELIVNQQTIFSFLQNAYAPIITFGVDLCKQIFEDKKFKTNDFLEWLEPLFYREDAKGSIKKLLPILEKIAKNNSKTSTKIAHLVSAIFVIPDLSLQERAVKTLLKTANKKDKTLNEKLSEYAGQMQGAVKSQLGDFLGKETDENEVFEAEKYEFKPIKHAKLVTEIQLPSDWNGILFQFGKFINNAGILDAEIVLHSFLLQQDLFPTDYQKQLEPYIKQLQKNNFDNEAKEFIKGFLIQKILKLNQQANLKFKSYQRIKIIHFYKNILKVVDEKMEAKSKLPLLSFPTHEPHWVAPKTLLERIIAYQNTNESIDFNDLSLAISRMPLENIDEALPLLTQLDEDLKNLFSFCFGIHQEIKIPKEGILNTLFQKTGGETKQSKFTALWAVAAQTFYQNDYFEFFDKTTISGVAFAGNPFYIPIHFKEKVNKWVDYQTKKEMQYAWVEMEINLPNYKKIPDHLLYSLDSFNVREYIWEYDFSKQDIIYYWNNLMPQNNEPLALKLLTSICFHTSNNVGGLKSFLQIVNRSDFDFSHYCSYVFGCCFLMEKKDIRLLACEVLYQKIENKALPIEQMSAVFAYLISNQYGVFSRFSDAVLSIKDSSPLHNQALFLIMDAVISEFGTFKKLPTNFKKFIENYYDLVTKLNKKPSEKTLIFLKTLEENASLKKLIKLLVC